MYKWKRGSVHNVDAEVAGEALKRMADKHGRLTPRLVVDESRPKKAPLHDEFEWNDSVAAEMYRENQARYVMRTITVDIVGREEKPPIRMFVNILPEPETETDVEPERCYVQTVEALQRPDWRQQVLERALKELEAWRQRYEDLEELAVVFASMDVVKENLKKPTPVLV